MSVSIPTIVRMTLREHALAALCLGHPEEKVTAVQALWTQREQLPLDTQTQLHIRADQVVPGRVRARSCAQL